MKALTLWQPWASLIAVGAKRYETRSWRTPYRGPLLICAAKKGVGSDYIAESVARSAAGQRALGGIDPRKLQLGCAVCLAELTACYPTEDLEEGDARFRGGVEHLFASDELYFGNFGEGRFAWRLDNVRALPAPIPIKGAQGLFDVFPDVEREVRRQLAERDNALLAAMRRAGGAE